MTIFLSACIGAAVTLFAIGGLGAIVVLVSIMNPWPELHEREPGILGDLARNREPDDARREVKSVSVHDDGATA